MDTTSDNLVAAATFSSDIAANIALGMLRTNGIPCVLYGEISKNVLGISLTPEDSIRLMVKVSDLEAAQTLLKQSNDE